ncbi:MAG: Y-family DNA polymerase [Alphaproteobacteria bacterium]|nr:Y-family DNA polymerase [Alphaproteobacteria bacterium]
MIGLLDANNFYASCERVFRPDLMHQPIAILSNNDGCIIARSHEVKALGIPMGAPYFQVKKILDQHRAVVFSSNFSLYGDMSCRMMTLLDALVPRMEIYSIDESFVDFSGIKDISKLVHHIKNHIWYSLGIPISIGVGETKTLAKVANQVAKRKGKGPSVHILKGESAIDEALQNLTVRDIWGIGRRMSERLLGFGIYTGLQLKQVDPRWMRRQFTVMGERLVQELNGISCLSLEDVRDPKKSIQVSRSFRSPIRELEDLRSVVASYAMRLGEKLRSDGLRTKNIMVHIRTNIFQKNSPQYRNHTVVTLPNPVEDDINLVKACTRALEDIFKEGFGYHKAGVMAFDLLSQEDNVQFDLFSSLPTEDQGRKELFQALDSLNKRYGSGTVSLAACGNKPRWRDGKKNVSPAYTTRWKDLPKVFAK